ncbi:MAG: hypothetical protein H6713_32735 [Myxococcales bacterium]|nr:hypothetical protein [Myxococcales bacterium]
MSISGASSVTRSPARGTERPDSGLELSARSLVEAPRPGRRSARSRALAWGGVALLSTLVCLATMWAAVFFTERVTATSDRPSASRSRSVRELARDLEGSVGRFVTVAGVVSIELDTREPLLPDPPTDRFTIADPDTLVFNPRVTIVNETGAPVEVVDDVLIEVHGRVERDPVAEFVLVADSIRRADAIDRPRQRIEPREPAAGTRRAETHVLE